MAVITAGTTKFPVELVREMYSKVKGHSSLAKMVPSEPIPFVGTSQFVFSADKKISVVGEGEAKPAGDGKVDTVTIRPVKVIYQARFTNEFLRMSEEKQINVLRTFAEGFSKQVAAGFDEMAMHGVDPATGNLATGTIGNNYLDYVIANYESGANVVEYGHDSTAADTNIDEALAKVDDPTGVILGKTIRAAIAALNISGARKYPEFAWGATPATLGGMMLDSNKTVEANNNDARAYVGDFNALKWGFADDITLEVIEYGDPDGTGKDLKRYNQVLLRGEAFIGWGILDAAAFATVQQGE